MHEEGIMTLRFAFSWALNLYVHVSDCEVLYILRAADRPIHSFVFTSKRLQRGLSICTAVSIHHPNEG